MQNNSVTLGTIIKRTERYCIECAIEPSGLEIRTLCTTLLPLPGVDILGTKVQLKAQQLTPTSLPYVLEKAQVDNADWVSLNLREAINMLFTEMLNNQIIDLHELSRYKVAQMAPIISSNDLKIDLMTKNFQPHLITVYPIFESGIEGHWQFGSRRDAWLFDYMIEMISYRRTGHKATLILYGLNSGLKKMSISDAINNDYTKILQECLNCGVELLQARLVYGDDNQAELFFESGCY
jgi:DNA-binding sugar fermentation-stimulating protein